MAYIALPGIGSRNEEIDELHQTGVLTSTRYCKLYRSLLRLRFSHMALIICFQAMIYLQVVCQLFPTQNIPEFLQSPDLLQ